ncbi:MULTISPECIES: hypothetical protein [Mycobacteriaceae]|uniref:Uncharacterized protein n=1 Tax=Mycolicibacterium canariasense TaxID=228230 RepID=A0A100WJU9_MYCCR|nr:MULTISPECIES: hypothetical protein [Mycobacteriaceae]MCV7210556.1 hypothetical protein [Mycolicibacterium canariasense]ORU97910.1 hypothetical protein AWB94_29300 [Mycolicibacterium canariasense]GAS99612.1 uncharacterized protein RMCC_6577 [Mycolicibacterium canariasense]SIN56445.1 Uncharacterised protein [Mycobacteroides abscessus subsp. abscessus]
MTTGAQSYVDAEYQGVELGVRHADLADCVALAAQWARAYRAAVPNDQRTDFDVAYPLIPHATTLEFVHAELARAISALTDATEVSVTRDAPRPAGPAAEVRILPHLDAVPYLMRMEPRSRYRVTHQDLWRSSLAHAKDYLSSVDEIDTRELDLKLSWYATVVQKLLDAAYTAVRDAYTDAVVATFCTVPDRVLPYTIASCLKDLTSQGFDDANCGPLLHRFADSFPNAVAECLTMPHKWQATQQNH